MLWEARRSALRCDVVSESGSVGKNQRLGSARDQPQEAHRGAMANTELGAQAAEEAGRT